MFNKFLSMLVGALLLVVAAAASSTPLSSFDGQPVNLANFQQKDKWTVVMMWASYCHVCNEEAPQVEQFHQAHADKDAVVVGISVDGVRKVRKAQRFIDEHGVTFPNMIADVAGAQDFYGSLTGKHFRATPTFILLNPAGEVVLAKAGALNLGEVERLIAAH